jgi:hypothetical protein
MIIAIIIVIVLVSSLVIYFYPNNTEYYNNGKSVNVRYFNCESYRYCRDSNYSVSSYSIHGNKISYLNSTMMDVFYADVAGGHEFTFTMDMHIKGINPKYVYVTVTGDNNTQYLETNDLADPNTTSYETSSDSSVVRINATENMNGYEFSISDMNDYVRNGVYNFTVKVSAGKLYDMFYIDTVEESAVYGCILNHDEPVKNYNFMIYAEDMDDKDIFNINIMNDSYYLFTNRNTNYSFYYMDNGTLKPLDVHTNYMESGSNYLVTGNSTESIEVNFAYMSDFT